MKQKDVVIGGAYLTYIGAELAKVVVCSVVEGRPESQWRNERRTSYRVRRWNAASHDILPKRRTAAALREE